MELVTGIKHIINNLLVNEFSEVRTLASQKRNKITMNFSFFLKVKFIDSLVRTLKQHSATDS